MSLTKEESKLIREALGVATSVSNDANLVAALRTLNTSLTDFEQYDDDSYKYSLVGAENIREAEQLADSVYPGAYTTAWAALRRELVAAPAVDEPPPPPPDVGNPDNTVDPPPVVPVGDFAAAVQAALASFDIHIIPGKLAIGMQPDPDYDASLQLGGNVAAEILGVSNTRGTDKQNPGEVHKNVVSVAGNDGGIRLIQYLGWGPKGRLRNTTNRRASILALDSQGDFCKSTQEIGSDSDGGQSWYIRTVGNVVEICTYKIGAFVRILKSVAKYGATDDAQL